MANYREDIVNIELENGNIHRSFLQHSIGAGDETANRFGVRAFRNGEPVSLSGSCMGLFIRADGATITISNGTVSGNLAYVTLPAACYAVEGNFSLAIKTTATGNVMTLRIVDGVVSRTSTNVVVDPGTVIPSIEDLIAAIDAAVASIPADYSGLWASIAPAFSTSAVYKAGQYVNYNGGTYRFMADHTGTWSSSDVEAVDLGREVTVRTATGIEPVNTWISLPVVENEYYRSSDGRIMSSNDYVRSENLIAVKPGDIISCLNACVCVYYGRNGEYISNASVTKNNLGTVQAGAYYVGICSRSASRAISVYMHAFITSPVQIGEGTNVPLVSDEYYDTSSGQIKFSDTYVRSKHLFQAEEKMLYAVDNSSTHVYFYDADFTFLGQFTSSTTPRKTSPIGTAYVGFASNAGITALKVTKIDSQQVNSFAYPFNKGCSYSAGYWISGSGAISTTENYDLLCMSNPVPGEKYYTNATDSVSCICLDNSGSVITMSEPETLQYNGRVHTIPSGAVVACWNIAKNKKHDGNISIVIDRVTKSEKVLCIGDSITWLDGRDMSESQSGNTRYLGYQKQLEAAGYIVNSAGYSGYAYAKTGGDHGSIYTKIVEEEYDVAGYDIIVLAGGTNDDLYAVPVGTVPEEYEHTFTAEELGTMAGALGAIIAYIRANNTNCKIVLCTQLKSESASRPFSEAVLYADAIRETAKVDSCFLLDLFEKMNVQPGTPGFDAFFYDTTHPNKAGMERMGKLVREAVELC